MYKAIYIKLQMPVLYPLFSKQQNISRIELRIENGLHFKVKLTRSGRP
jgi:hypothetical protein